MNDMITVVLIAIVGLVALFMLSRWRTKRAMRQLIWIFREHSAVGIKNAKTVDELGLRPRGALEGGLGGMLRGRDYRQYTLNALMQAEIIQVTEDGKLYLSEDKLAESSFGRDVSSYR